MEMKDLRTIRAAKCPEPLYKLPLWKLFVFFGLLIAGYTLVSAFDAIAHPTIAANIAVNQLDDTESGAIAIRTYDRAQNFFPFGVWGITIFIGAYLVFGTALFRADLVRLITRLPEKH
jgi:hypothetical protein